MSEGEFSIAQTEAGGDQPVMKNNKVVSFHYRLSEVEEQVDHGEWMKR